jgi:hypothetical protein
MAPAIKSPLLALFAAVAVGLIGFQFGGAPHSYAVVNAFALSVAAALAVAVGRVPAGTATTAILLAFPVMVGATLVVGPGLDGVHRWLALGSLRLHAAALFAPAFIVAWQTRNSWSGTLSCVLLSGVIALQPDMAAALALASAVALSLLSGFSHQRAVALGAALVALAVTVLNPDRLAPVPFVERVLQDQAASGMVGGWMLTAVCTAALGAAIFAPCISRTGRNSGGLALSGWFAGLTVASLLGNFPSPLIGYGAAPIIGYGMAIGLIGKELGSRSVDRKFQS